jgi:hypothetical protein
LEIDEFVEQIVEFGVESVLGCIFRSVFADDPIGNPTMTRLKT